MRASVGPLPGRLIYSEGPDWIYAMMMIPEHRIPPLLISFKNFAKRKLLFSHPLAELTVNSLFRKPGSIRKSQFILKALEQRFSTSAAHLASPGELFTTLTPRLLPGPMKSDVWSWDTGNRLC